jgi:hypothetical protein
MIYNVVIGWGVEGGPSSVYEGPKKFEYMKNLHGINMYFYYFSSLQTSFDSKWAMCVILWKGFNGF